jgi:hypothetical protein
MGYSTVIVTELLEKKIVIPTSLPVSDSLNFIFYGKRAQIHVLFVYTDFFLVNLARLKIRNHLKIMLI